MSRATIAYLALLVSFLGLAQTRPPHLNWDWRRAEELSWKESITRTKNIADEERNRLIAAISQQLLPSAADLGITTGELRTVAGETRVKYVDLDGDGKPEVIAQAGGEKSGCSPTGNCPLWVLRRRGNKYYVLLEAEAQTFTVQPSRNGRFSDLVLTRHGSAFESEARVYKFNGEAYSATRCFDVHWSISGSDGEYHKLKDPKIAGCDEPRSSTD